MAAQRFLVRLEKPRSDSGSLQSACVVARCDWFHARRVSRNDAYREVRRCVIGLNERSIKRAFKTAQDFIRLLVRNANKCLRLRVKCEVIKERRRGCDLGGLPTSPDLTIYSQPLDENGCQASCKAAFSLHAHTFQIQFKRLT